MAGDSSIFKKTYNTIKDKILHLEYRPGQSISIASIAESLGVSRTPVHDALVKLSTENLIDMFPQSGSRVSLIDIKKCDDERFLRKALEIYALQDMFYAYDESYLKEMEKCIVEQKKAFQENRLIDVIYWDDNFHRQIFKCIGREYCCDISHMYSANEYRVRLLALKAINSTQDVTLHNHNDIIRFIRSRDLKALISVEEQHLSRIAREITVLVAEYPNLFTSSNSEEVPQNIRAKKEYNENFLETIGKMNLKD